jgi:deoxyribose-phosphate aldolase
MTIENKVLDNVIQGAINLLKKSGLSIESGYGDVKNHLGNIDPFSVTDLTYLKQNGGEKEIKELCKNAKDLKAKTVCVNSVNIEMALKELEGSEVKVITVEGFPLGSTSLKNIISSAKNDVEVGVSEVDIVFPHVFMNNEDYVGALNYLKEFRKNVSGILKVILEVSEYSSENVAIMSLLCKEANMDFVKTSTGFSSRGADVFSVALMRRCVGNEIGVKASGGIKTTEQAMDLINHGATRIGASGLKNDSNY